MMNQQPIMDDPSAMMGQPPMPEAPQAPMAPPQPPPQDDGSAMMYELDGYVTDTNLARKLQKKKDKKSGNLLLDTIGSNLLQAIENDKSTCDGWTKANKEWLKMALLIRENKTYPWPMASNVKYPLLSTAAMQFSARSYPSLVPSDGAIVKVKAIPSAVQGMYLDMAQRVARHMSWIVMHKIPNWEEDMDKLLITLSIVGTCFKKTYFDVDSQSIMSTLVYPENFIVNYGATSLDRAYRKTEILYYTKNEYEERVRNDETFLDIGDLGQARPLDKDEKDMNTGNSQGKIDEATPHPFYACHTYLDLDEDGYEEPYVVTIHVATGKVVRITARFGVKGITRNSKDEVVRITPIEYFTDFQFIPNPAGSVFGLGFGSLLGPLNESVNTLINQLIDAGTINNLQSGFIGKNLRIELKQARIIPGEWVKVNATGEDLQKSIYPLPSKEPSDVLFQLMNFLVTSGNQLASIAEIFVGKMPGQNTPATTTQETVQQSMAVFTAIYKRVYRSLAREFIKIMHVIRRKPDMVAQDKAMTGLDITVEDYSLPEYYIIPGADPVGDSITTKQAKLDQVGNLLQLGTISVEAFTKRVLAVNEIPNPEELQQAPPPPQPDPKAQLVQAQTEAVKQKLDMEAAAKDKEMEHKERMGQLEAALKQMQMQFKAQEAQMDMVIKRQTAETDAQLQREQGAQDLQLSRVKGAIEIESNARTLAHQEKTNAQKLKQGDESFKQKQQQQKQQVGKKKSTPK